MLKGLNLVPFMAVLTNFDALNSGVRITLRQTEPTKNGMNSHALCVVPLIKNAGRCQVLQISPSMMYGCLVVSTGPLTPVMAYSR